MEIAKEVEFMDIKINDLTDKVVLHYFKGELRCISVERIDNTKSHQFIGAARQNELKITMKHSDIK